MKIAGENMGREIAQIPDVMENLLQVNWIRLVQSTLSQRNPNAVIIAARGTSDNAAHFMKYLIETRIGTPCGLASPSAATLYESPMNYSETLVILMSQSGQSPDLLIFAEKAKSAGALLLAFTNDATSPLAHVADQHIDLLAGEEIAIPATKSYIAEILAAYLFVCAWQGVEPLCQELPKAASALIGAQNESETFVSHLDISQPIYVLGRGISYPNAREFALKLQETSLIPVQSHSTSDFLHGPIASLQKFDQVILMSPFHLPETSFGEAPKKIRSVVNRLYWVGLPSQNIEGDIVLSGARASNEVTSSICDAVSFQIATRVLAIRNGIDPDHPRGLAKVTLTK